MPKIRVEFNAPDTCDGCEKHFIDSERAEDCCFAFPRIENEEWPNRLPECIAAEMREEPEDRRCGTCKFFEREEKGKCDIHVESRDVDPTVKLGPEYGKGCDGWKAKESP